MKNNIKSLELFSLIIILIISSFSGIGFNVIIHFSGIDAYIAVLLSIILGLISLFSFLIIFKYQPELPINLKLKNIYGNTIGTIINYFFIIISLIIGIIYMYNLINFTLNHYLTNTPIFIIGLIFILLIIYTNFKGLTTICRISFILMILNFILFSFPFINLMPQTNIDNLKPFLHMGISSCFKAAFNLVLLTINNIFILTIIPKKSINDSKNISKYIIIAYIIAIIIMFFITFITLNILGIRLVSYYQDPEYIVLKQVNLFNFLNRIENVISMQWLNSMYISITFIIYYISNAIKTNNQDKYIPTIIGILILIMSLLIFKNSTQFHNFILNILPIIRLITFIIFIITAIIILFKQKK